MTRSGVQGQTQNSESTADAVRTDTSTATPVVPATESTEPKAQQQESAAQAQQETPDVQPARSKQVEPTEAPIAAEASAEDAAQEYGTEFPIPGGYGDQATAMIIRHCTVWQYAYVTAPVAVDAEPTEDNAEAALRAAPHFPAQQDPHSVCALLGGGVVQPGESPADYADYYEVLDPYYTVQIQPPLAVASNL